MKTKQKIVFIVLVFIIGFNLSAQVDSKNFSKNFCLIETNCKTLKDANLTAKFINNNGGQVAVITSPNYFIGWIPESIHSNLLGRNKITLISNKKIDATHINDNNKVIANYFNSVVTKEIFLKNKSVNINYTNNGCIVPNDNEIQNRITGNICDNSNNSEYMIGSVYCRLFFLESDGSIDTNEFTWTLDDYNDIKGQAIDAWTIWSYTANQNNISVTYLVEDYGFGSSQNNQPYEPINHGKTSDRLWINAIMDNVNIAENTSVTHRVHEYNAIQKEIHGADHAYTTFIAYNPNGAPNTFTHGASAYVRIRKAYVQLLFRNGSWSSDNFFRVYGHETGHIFNAFDEYHGSSSLSTCDTFFNGVQNLNHEDCDENNNLNCIMNNNTFFGTGNSRQWDLCEYTKSHIGWENLTPKPTLQIPSNGGIFTHNTVLFEWDRNTSNQNIHSYIKILNLNTGEEMICNDLNTNTGVFDTLPNGEYEWSITNGNNDVNNDYAMVTSDSWIFTITELAPDLIVENIWTNPSNPQFGDQIDLLVKIKNIGGITANSISLTYSIDDQIIGTDTHSTLDPNDTRIEIFHDFIFTTNGNHDYCVDIAINGNEQNTSNNSYCMVVTVASSTSFADLETLNTIANPDIIEAGNTTNLSCLVRNNGNAPCGSTSKLRYYLSTNNTWSADDIELNNFDHVGNLNIGEVSNESNLATIPSNTTAGNWYILFFADADTEVIELDETNNVGYFPIVVTASASLSDLVVINQNATPSTLQAGESTNLSCLVKNIGTEACLESTKLRYFLSNNISLSAEDILLSGFDYVGELNPNETNIEFNTTTIPTSISPGTWYILFVSDADEEEAEIDETNNVSFKQITITSNLPDVITTNETLNISSAQAGTYIIASCIVNNIGPSFTGSSSRVGYYFSNDIYYDGTDILLDYDGFGNIGPSPGPGNTSNESEWLRIPFGTAPGTYYILFYVDDENTIIEANEENNIRYLEITVLPPLPDLIVLNQTISSVNVDVGDEINVSCSIKNIGDAPSNSCVLRYFISDDNIWSSNDYEFNEFSFVNSLIVNETNTFSINVTIPSNFDDGNKYILFYIDFDTDVVEEDESNNIKDKPITINEVKIWEFSQWTNGVPSLLDDAIIKDDYYTLSNGNIEAKTLKVTSENTLYINENNYVKSEGSFINNGTITLEPTASFVQIDNSATNTGLGVFNVKIETTPLDDKDRFTYFSSPSQNVNLQVFNTWANMSRIWDFDSTNQQWNLLDGNETMSNGIGYAVKPSATNSFPFNGSINFQGFFNNGIFQQPLVYNDGGTDDDNILVGNPYPSAIDASMLLNNNIGTNAIYMWIHNSELGENGYVSNDYVIWNNTGGTASESGGAAPTGFIATGQGFFLDAITNGILVFNNAMRVTGNNDDFRRPTNNNDKIWINLTNSDGFFSQILIAFIDEGSNDFDPTFDAKRINSGSVASFYSIGTNNELFGIEARGILIDEQTIPVGIETLENNASNYTIAIDHLENLEDVEVLLKDNLLNIVHNLNVSNYNFNLLEIGENNNRFEIIFRSNALNTNDEFLNENITIYPNPTNSIVNISTKNVIIDNIKIYDSTGKLIKMINDNTSSISLGNLSNGIYFVKIQSDTKILIKKIVKN